MFPIDRCLNGLLSFHSAAASLALSVTYGRQLTGEDSYSMVQQINEITSTMTTAAAPANATWIELFPVFCYLPEFLATWKRIGREQYTETSTTYRELIQSVQDRLVNLFENLTLYTLA